MSQLRLPKPDDHARAQLDRLDRAGPQRLAHVQPAAQVLGAAARLAGATPPRYTIRPTPARAAACAKVEAAATLAPVIVGAFADSVHEVERRAAAVERARARGWIPDVALDPVEPGRTGAGAGRVSRQAAHVPARPRERRPYGPADEAGRAGEEQRSRRGGHDSPPGDLVTKAAPRLGGLYRASPPSSVRFATPRTGRPSAAPAEVQLAEQAVVSISSPFPGPAVK